jgi:hypothetical protein
MSLKSKIWFILSVCLFIVPVLASLAQDTGTGAEATAEATAEVTQTPAPEATVEVTVEPGPGIIIVIEGPVEEVNVNIITIYDIDIRVDADDPVLTVIRIGDVLRIEGELTGDDDDDDTTINLVAINIIFINVEVFVVDGQVWRDSGNCGDGPPPWAPAHGWRRRCEGNGGGTVVTGGGGTTIIIIGGDSGSGSGSGMGMGMGKKNK